MLNNSNTYTTYVNFKIKELFGKFNNSIIFGQNIIAGSRVSGIGADFENIKTVLQLIQLIVKIHLSEWVLVYRFAIFPQCLF